MHSSCSTQPHQCHSWFYCIPEHASLSVVLTFSWFLDKQRLSYSALLPAEKIGWAREQSTLGSLLQSLNVKQEPLSGDTCGCRCLLFVFHLPHLPLDMGKGRNQSHPPKAGFSFNINEDFAEIPRLLLPVPLGLSSTCYEIRCLGEEEEC